MLGAVTKSRLLKKWANSISATNHRLRVSIMLLGRDLDLAGVENNAARALLLYANFKSDLAREAHRTRQPAYECDFSEETITLAPRPPAR